MASHIGTLAISDTGFVFDPRTGNTYAVNATGLAVLRGLKSGHTLHEIQADLTGEFEQVGSVEEHVHEFMLLLVELGLLPESEAFA